MKDLDFGPTLRHQSDMVVAALVEQGLTIVTAESCTAGLLAALLARAEGASKALQGGFVTYTKAQKTQALGVPAALLRDGGAVTGQVASLMASGALDRSPASFAIAITGVLGPMPDEDGNPVGTAYLSLADRNGFSRCERATLGKGDPHTLCAQALSEAVRLILNHLTGRGTARARTEVSRPASAPP
jgi:PncC family amidohydrolase